LYISGNRSYYTRYSKEQSFVYTSGLQLGDAEPKRGSVSASQGFCGWVDVKYKKLRPKSLQNTVLTGHSRVTVGYASHTS